MRRRIEAVVVATLWVAVGGACSPSPAAPSDNPLIPSQQLEAAIDDWAGVPGHQGVSASVIFADGAQWSASSGQAAFGEPLQRNHLISIASITKTMVSALILQMADEGLLALDDPISRWLSPREFIEPTITVRQLLNHTNGLDNYTSHAEVGQAAAVSPSRVFSADDLLGFVGPPRFPPGAQTEYTNTAFVLLGQIVEHVSGQSFVRVLHQRLLDPLQLNEVYFPGHESAPAPIAAAMSPFGLVPPLDYLSTLSIGGTAFGLMASAQDVARWGHALYTGSVISSRMQQEMRILVPAAGNIPGESGSGLGLRGYSYLGRMQIGHSGGSSFGSSLLLHDTGARITVVVIMNQQQGAGHFSLGPQLLQLALQR